jgi:hypothetical protein
MSVDAEDAALFAQFVAVDGVVIGDIGEIGRRAIL